MGVRSKGRNILIFGAAILIVVILISGSVVFKIMQAQGERLLSRSLELALKSRADTFGEGIRQAIQNSLNIVTRPSLVREVEQANNSSKRNQSLTVLNNELESFLPAGFSAVAIYGENGKQLAIAGTFISKPELRLPLPTDSDVELLWKGGLILRSRKGFEYEGRTIGHLVSEQPLTSLDPLLFNLSALGRTGDLAVCGPHGSTMVCLPTTLHPTPIPAVARVMNGQPLPMVHALDGESGVLTAKDYRRQEVVAAYRPLQNTGLGMVLKLDAKELYAPVWKQLVYVLPALSGLVLVGLFLLWGLIAPLVRSVVASETEARESNERLRDSETELRSVFENVDDGIVVMDSNGVIEAFNPGAGRIFGYAATEVLGRDISTLIPEAQAPRGSFVQRYMRNAEPSVAGVGREFNGKRRNGKVVTLDLRMAEMQIAGSTKYIAAIHDITERKLNEARILYLATHDALTNLPNRNLFLDRASQAFIHAKRNNGIVALLFVDLDEFKQVNDTFGHDVGDWLLSEVASRIGALLRKEDTLARQGGDEFIIALPQVADANDAALVAQKILDVVSAPYHKEEIEIRVGASIGIGLYPDDGDSVEAVLKCADTAMYFAKAGAGSGFCLYRDCR